MATVLHLQGEVLVGPEDVRPEAWVVGGRLTFERPTASGDDVQVLRGYVLPGLVDAHCHVGLDAHGAVDEATSEAQALADREAGTLLIRDAGSPADTRWIDERDDLPKIIRAGRHIARTRRYIRNFAHEIEPDQLVERVRLEARAGDGWVKLVGDWIDRDARDLTPCWPVDVLTDAIAAAHEEGRPGHGALLRRGVALRLRRGRHRLHRARHRAGGRDHRPVRRAADRDRPDAGQHRDLPGARRTRPGEVPRLPPPDARAARTPLRHHRRGP